MEDLMSVLIGDNNENGIEDQLLKDRKIVLNSDVADWCVNDVCMQIMKWNQEDKDIIPEKRKKIYILINSGGGDAISGMNMLDVIVNSDTPVVTIGFGMAASMAGYILAAGHERYCFLNTVVLIHDGESGYQSSGRKGKDIQAFYDKISERLEDFLVEHTDMTHEYLQEIADRDVYLFGEESKEKGIVDKIIGIDCNLNEVF